MAIFGAICLTVIFLMILMWVSLMALEFVDAVRCDGWCFEPVLNFVGCLYVLIALTGWGFVGTVVTNTFLRVFA